jgi:hypothetical protein
MHPPNAIQPAIAAPAACPSCGAQAAGRYCSVCGERFLSEADFNFRHFLVHHLPHEMMHWDGKLGRTLRQLVFAPGEMAAQYVRGRRQPYLNPLRLYLVVFVVQAFLSGIGTPTLTLSESVQRYDSTGLAAKLLAKQINSDAGKLTHAHFATYAHWSSEAGTLLVFLLIAWAQLAIMRKYHRRYLEHLMLSLNVATFILLVLIVGDIVTLVAGRGSISEVAESYRLNAPGYLLPIYWFFAIRRFYGTTWSGAIVYGVAISVANVLIAIVLNLLVALLLVALV